MILHNAWKRTALSLGIGWSHLWSFVLPKLPFTPQLNLCLRDRPNSRYWLFPILLLGSFGLLGAGLYWARWLLPIPLILLTWGATVFSILIAIELSLQKKLINQQQCEIDRLQTVEQTAVISQARKLMHRLASDIHDGPLQELKLIMDRLEILQMESPQLPIDPILDQLSTLGTHLRQHLSDTRAIALTITPELRDGLAQGIQTRLTQLVQSGELTLHVIQHLHPLEEPTLNSLWLEAREDIYRFLNEAIHNVILHAQPPHGTATQITVSLEQQNTLCTLTLENDGVPVDPAVFEPTPKQRQRGGYGTKLMDTIAAELPEGSLERIPLEAGGLRVQLTWKQDVMLKS
jgi:signal transduction histidine kinase